MQRSSHPSSPAVPAESPIASPEEISLAVQKMDPVPPLILNVAQAAEISHYTVGTLRKLAGQDRFPGSTIKGKPLRFWRDKFVWEVVNKQPPIKSRKAKSFREESASKSGGRK